MPIEPQPIIEPQDRQKLEQAMEKSEKIHQRGNMSIRVFQHGAPEIVLNELGRVREESFRAFGFGSGSSCDRDEYDYAYDHLIIWNEELCDIAGSYRVRINRSFEALQKSCIWHHYHFDSSVMDVVDKSVELGRSVVAIPYMKTRVFDDLFRAISLYLFRNSCRYFIGTLSFDEKTQVEDLQYLQKIMATDDDIVKHIYPRNPNKAWCPHNITQEDRDRTMKERVGLLKKHNRHLEIRYPSLLFHYLNATSRCLVLPYHHDRIFHSIDAMIVHDTNYAYDSYRNRYLTETQD